MSGNLGHLLEDSSGFEGSHKVFLDAGCGPSLYGKGQAEELTGLFVEKAFLGELGEPFGHVLMRQFLLEFVQADFLFRIDPVTASWSRQETRSWGVPPPGIR